MLEEILKTGAQAMGLPVPDAALAPLRTYFTLLAEKTALWI
jgi:hypothetical protein